MESFAGSARGRAGLLLIAAGILTWGLAAGLDARRSRADAARMLNSAGYAAALVELSHAGRAVRDAVLDQALSSEPAAEALRLHEHGISVALSRVDYAEAVRLYREILRRKLDSEESPTVLQESYSLVSRWSLLAEISADDAARFAGRLAGQMTGAGKAGRLGEFSPALELLAPRLTPQAAGALASRLFPLVATRDGAAFYDALHALTAIAPRLAPVRRRELAMQLGSQISTAPRGALLQAFAPLFAALSTDLDEATAAGLCAPLATRILAEIDPGSLDVLVSSLRGVAARVSPADALRISQPLLERIKLEADAPVLLFVTQALAAFGGKLPKSVFEQAGEALLRRIREERNAAALSELALSLGVLKDRATAEQFEEAGSHIVARFAEERDMQAIAALASAIDSVADDLRAPTAGRISARLVDRMMEERRTGSLHFIATGLGSIADEAEGTAASTLAARLTGGMRGEEDSQVLRIFAFSVAAFKKAPGNDDAAAKLLVARMETEQDPGDLRNLSAGLFSLRDKTSAAVFDRAALILASAIEVRTEPTGIVTLAACLHALSKKAGALAYERAASAMVANVNQLEQLEPALQRIAPKVGSAKARELADTLVSRMAREHDPERLRVLGRALGDLPGPAGANPGNVLAIADAPCGFTHSAAELFNPLCSESSWSGLAAETLHLNRVSAGDAIEPDFLQLSPDDDDDATGDSSEGEAELDFHRVSDAVSALRGAPPEPIGNVWVKGLALALALSGVLALAGARAARNRFS